jgi:c-di-GMP-binding flagellar brake protein YcgR
MWDGIDRRRFPRVHYPCKVEVFQKGYKKAFLTQTENIGVGGICVILQAGLEKFSLVELIITLTDGEPPIKCDGRIVWAVKGKTQFDTGIEFLDIKEKDILRIERVIQQCQKESPTSFNNLI